NATRCLSYLTIETRGAVAEEWRPSVAREIFGCDVCQDVCPWNRRAAVSGDPAWQSRETSRSAPILDWCRRSDEDWRSRMKDSAMRRAGLRRVRRSLAYAAASLSTEARATALDALLAHPSARDTLVADAIAWAKAIKPR